MHYLLISHGPFSKAILESAEMITGKSDNIQTLSVTMDSTLSGTTESIKNIYEENNEGDLIIICDILGGTPSNASMQFIAGKDNVRILTGLNLPMLLELLLNSSTDIDQLVDNAKNSYTKGLSAFKSSDLESKASQDNNCCL